MIGVVLGGAACVWEDLAALEAMRRPDIVLAVNEAGCAYPGHLDHWVTLHPDKLPAWEERRTGNRDYTRWGGTWERQKPRPGLVDRVIPAWGVGTSAMHGVAVYYELEVPKIVLCGVPLDDQPHFHSADPWPHAGLHHQAWLDHRARIDGRVKSMSGWTMELLGAPDAQWLQS